MQLVDPADTGDRGLTPRRRKIVQVIEESVRRNGYGPSMREIAEATGLASTSSVSHQFRVLEEQGLVSRTKRRPRTTRLQPRNDPADQRQPARRANQCDGFKVIPVPLVGRIPAGGPKLADESIDDVIPLPAQLVGHGELIMLSVDGDSMAGAAITNGDWVVVRRQPDAENGDIVAAMLESDTSADGEATVKTFLRRDGHVWLMPQNPKIPADRRRQRNHHRQGRRRVAPGLTITMSRDLLVLGEHARTAWESRATALAPAVLGGVSRFLPGCGASLLPPMPRRAGRSAACRGALPGRRPHRWP